VLGASAPASQQKIRQANEGGPMQDKASKTNHLVMIGNDEQSVGSAAGSFVHDSSVANGMSDVSKKSNFSCLDDDEHFMYDFTSNCLINEGDTYGAVYVVEPKLVSSLEQTKGGSSEDLMVTRRDGLANLGLQGSMEIASSPRANGKDPVPS
jgi:predicted glutamine amidotransferase